MISERKLYKLRMEPEDFIVEEILNFSEDPDGKYYLYLLEKRKLSTYEVLKLISSLADIPLRSIGYSGMKDKHALCYQYITLPKKVELEEKNFKLSYICTVKKRLKLGEHIGNKFTITLRKMKPRIFKSFPSGVEYVSREGLPNYYDSQRFGSMRGSKKFIVEEIARGRYEEALRIYLTSKYRKQKSYIKQIKDIIQINWGNWKEIREKLEKMPKYENFLEIIKYLEGGGDYFGALKLIRQQLMKLFSSSYQSFLWNEAVKRMLVEKLGEKRLVEVEYLAGSLYFPARGISTSEFRELELDLPNRHNLEDIYVDMLKSRGFEIEDFDILYEFNAGFHSSRRKVFIFPQDMEVLKSGRDDRGNYITVSFFLPRGSYATTVLKAITSASLT